MEKKNVIELERELTEIFNAEYEQRHLITPKNTAEKLTEQDYRKQIQGEWNVVNEKYPRYACTACNHLYNNKGFKYCPNFGAKMKGE